MITAASPRRRTEFFWWVLLAIAIHAICFALYAFIVHLFPRISTGATESVSQTTTIEIEPPIVRPSPPPPAVRRRVRPALVIPAGAPRHELARESPTAPPQPPPRPHALAPRGSSAEAAYAREVAQLNKQDDPHAIPTIDPASRTPSSKSYAFGTPESLAGGSHGNGYITPTTSWKDHGQDCYYGRYEYTYPDGAEEDGAIAWPFCYEPAADPFHGPRRLIPFPLPQPGYVLPAGTQLPPIEKDVYESWIASH